MTEIIPPPESIIIYADLPLQVYDIDGDGKRVVAFPDDGHPTYCCEAIDLMGDSRDELVVWDYKSMYIYTQKDNSMKDAYKPIKYPHYNASNYRGEYSYPDVSYLTFKK